MKLVYIAGSYRHPTAWGVEKNIWSAREMGAAVAQLGLDLFPVVPHANTAHFEGLREDEYFLQGTLELLRRSDAVLVLPGSADSQGTKAEVTEAERLGKPVFDNMPHLKSWAAEPGCKALHPNERVAVPGVWKCLTLQEIAAVRKDQKNSAVELQILDIAEAKILRENAKNELLLRELAAAKNEMLLRELAAVRKDLPPPDQLSPETSGDLHIDRFLQDVIAPGSLLHGTGQQAQHSVFLRFAEVVGRTTGLRTRVDATTLNANAETVPVHGATHRGVIWTLTMGPKNRLDMDKPVLRVCSDHPKVWVIGDERHKVETAVELAQILFHNYTEMQKELEPLVRISNDPVVGILRLTHGPHTVEVGVEQAKRLVSRSLYGHPGTPESVAVCADVRHWIADITARLPNLSTDQLLKHVEFEMRTGLWGSLEVGGCTAAISQIDGFSVAPDAGTCLVCLHLAR